MPSSDRARERRGAHASIAGDAADEVIAALIGQFSDPFTFVRELIQNSLDAASATIEVRMSWADGVLDVDVIDDGEGMDRAMIEGYPRQSRCGGRNVVEAQLSRSPGMAMTGNRHRRLTRAVHASFYAVLAATGCGPISHPGTTQSDLCTAFPMDELVTLADVPIDVDLSAIRQMEGAYVSDAAWWDGQQTVISLTVSLLPEALLRHRTWVEWDSQEAIDPDASPGCIERWTAPLFITASTADDALSASWTTERRDDAPPEFSTVYDAPFDELLGWRAEDVAEDFDADAAYLSASIESDDTLHGYIKVTNSQSDGVDDGEQWKILLFPP